MKIEIISNHHNNNITSLYTCSLTKEREKKENIFSSVNGCFVIARCSIKPEMNSKLIFNANFPHFDCMASTTISGASRILIELI